MQICVSCGTEYDKRERLGKPGRATICEECAEEEADVQKYTGLMIYSHKCGSSIQINSDPKLTEYIINATKLKNKGSNMNDNIVQSGKYKTHTQGACVITADSFSYKNRSDI